MPRVEHGSGLFVLEDVLEWVAHIPSIADLWRTRHRRGIERAMQVPVACCGSPLARILASASVERTSPMQAIIAATIVALAVQPEAEIKRGVSAFFFFQDAGLVV